MHYRIYNIKGKEIAFSFTMDGQQMIDETCYYENGRDGRFDVVRDENGAPDHFVYMGTKVLLKDFKCESPSELIAQINGYGVQEFEWWLIDILLKYGTDSILAVIPAKEFHDTGEDLVCRFVVKDYNDLFYPYYLSVEPIDDPRHHRLPLPTYKFVDYNLYGIKLVVNNI